MTDRFPLIFNSGAGQIQELAASDNLDLTSSNLVNAGILFTSSGSATAPSLQIGSGTTYKPGLYSPGTDQLAISINGTQRINIEADGDINIDGGGVFYDATNNRLAIGTTAPQSEFVVSAGGGVGFEVDLDTVTSINHLLHYNRSISAFISHRSNALDHRFETSSTEKARIDSSGRLLVGTSSSVRSGLLEVAKATADTQIQITESSDSGGGPTLRITRTRGSSLSSPTPAQDGNFLGRITFDSYDTAAYRTGAEITAAADGQTWASGDCPGRLVFSVTGDGSASPTERMRIDSGGELNIFTATGKTVFGARSATGAGTTDRTITGIHSATSTTATGTISFQVFTNGNTQNTNNSYAGISDVKLKENIVDAGSQWDDVKALQVRNYNFKEETGHETHTQIGLVAQEVELVSPGLVFESPDRDADGSDFGTVTKGVNYSVLYMKAVKALQEAMERIEQLETSNTDLLARVIALEAN